MVSHIAQSQYGSSCHVREQWKCEAATESSDYHCHLMPRPAHLYALARMPQEEITFGPPLLHHRAEMLLRYIWCFTFIEHFTDLDLRGSLPARPECTCSPPQVSNECPIRRPPTVSPQRLGRRFSVVHYIPGTEVLHLSVTNPQYNGRHQDVIRSILLGFVPRYIHMTSELASGTI